MKKRRWIIHKPDGGFTGPMTAVEIREALRNGELDPSTMVSLEGSAIKREILSTDELFQTEETLYEDHAADPTNIVNTIKGKSSFLGLAAPDEVEVPEKDYSKKNRGKKRAGDGKRKKYCLIDRNGKKSKKMAASEVLYLYKKGRLHRETRVAKEGSSQTIGIRDFLKAYQTGGSKPLNQENKKAFEPKSQVHPAPRKDLPGKSTSPPRLTTQTIIFTLSFAGLLIICVWLLSDRLHNPPQETTPYSGSGESLPQRPLPTARIDQPVKSPPPLPKIEAEERAPSRRPLKNPEPQKNSLPAGLPGEVSASLRGLDKKAGQVSVFGPLSFSSKDLRECTIKCQIKMRDQSGKDVLVIFFKAAYIAQLSGKGSRIYIQATVGARGKTLYLSKVF